MTTAAVALGAAVYIEERARVIRSKRVLRGVVFGTSFLLGMFATGALCVWLLESKTWMWLREILGPLGGAFTGYLGICLVDGEEAGNDEGVERSIPWH